MKRPIFYHLLSISLIKQHVFEYRYCLKMATDRSRSMYKYFVNQISAQLVGNKLVHSTDDVQYEVMYS
jgi:hypothetical protein